MKKLTLLVLLVGLVAEINAQNLRGLVVLPHGEPLPGATVVFRGQREWQTTTTSNGTFELQVEAPGMLLVFAPGFRLHQERLASLPAQPLRIQLQPISEQLGEVQVRDSLPPTEGMRNLRAVEGFGIYAARKTEVVAVQQVTGNLSTNNARQVLAKVAGLNIWESDGAGLQLGIGGRGLSPNRTSNFNTRQDGYDMAADALGYPESYYSPPAEALERIEIVRGAASLQYGTQFGGMVNFRLQTAPDSGWQVRARLTSGSFGFRSAYASAGWRKGRNDGFAFVQHKQGDGWRPNSGFDAQTAYLQTGWRSRSGKSYHKMAYTHMRYLAQQPGGLTDTQFEQDPRQSNRPRNWFAINWNLFAHEWEQELGPRTRYNARTFGLYAGRAALGNLERINVADAVVGNRTLIDGTYQNLGHESRLLHRMGLSQLLVGVRLYQGTTTARQGDASSAADADFRLLNPAYPEGSDYRFPNQNAALFAEYLWQLGPRWKITAGARAEYIRTRAEGFYRQRVFDFAGNVVVDRRINEATDRSRAFVIGGLGASYQAGERGEWYANLAQNYRAINFSDLRVVNPNFRIDPNLQDERGYTADLGYRGKPLSWMRVDGSFFWLFYNNKIGQVLRADQPPLFLDYRLRTNVAAARSVGVEMLIEADVWKSKSGHQWQVYANGAYTHARYLRSNEPGIEGKQVELVPPIIVRSGLQHRFKNWRTALQYSWVASHFSDATNAIRTATAVEGRIPAYGVADWSLSYQIKHWRLEASVNNLFNAMYFTRRADGYPGPGIIPSDGRSFFLTLQYGWQR